MKILLIDLLLSLFAFTQPNSNTNTTVSFIISSSVNIKVKSNVHSFNCKSSTNYGHDTLYVRYEKEDNIYSVENAFLEIDLNGFNCGNPLVNKDFATLLQKDTYPTIKIYIEQIMLNEMKAGNCPGKVDYDIEIAGVKKHFETKFSSSITKGKRLVEGELALSLSDFNLTPPKKLLGLIKVSDEILIEFHYFIEKTSIVRDFYHSK